MRYTRKTTDEQRTELMMHVEIRGSNTALKRCKDVLQDLEFAEVVIDYQQKEIERLRAELKTSEKLVSGELVREFYGEPIPGDESYVEEATHERS